MDNRSTRTGGGDGGTRLNAADQTRREPDIETPGATDVLGILDGIESQFDRLRTIRHEQVDALRTLTERSLKLQQEEEAVAESRQKLDAAQEDWEQARHQEERTIEEVRTCLEADRSTHVRRVEEDKRTLERDRETLESDQERLRGDLETSRTRNETRSMELEQQSRILDDKEASLSHESVELKEEQEQFEARTSAAETAHQEVIEALEAAHFTIARRGRRIGELDSIATRIRRVRNRARRRLHGLASANRFYRKQTGDLHHRIKQQESRLEEAGRRMQSFMEHLREQADLVQQGHASLALADELKSRVQQLESVNDGLQKEIDQARIELRDVETRSQTQEPDAEPSMERHRAGLAEIARHLHRRRTRLTRVKQALQTRDSDPIPREDGAEMIEQRMRQSEIIEQRQRELDDVRCMLATSEKKMIRRWAGPRAIVVTGWMLTMIAMIAVGSWFMADHLRPPVRTASVSLAPQIMKGQEFDAKDSMAWVAMHQSQLQSDQFIREIAQRSTARRLTPWDSYAAVHQLMTDELSVDDAVPGKLILTLASDDGARATRFLDILASSMAVETQRTISSRPGGHTSSVLDPYMKDGATRHASLEPGLLRDDRLVTAGMLFSGGFVISFMFIGIVYARLLRAKRIFEETHSGELDVPVMQARPI